MLDVMSKPKVAQTTSMSPKKPVAAPFLEDPLGLDQACDTSRLITDRQLLRLIIVAAHTAARFEREALDVDPVAWMLSPRKAFFGKAPVNACHEMSGFTRAIVLHGLAIGLDADPHSIDDLTSPIVARPVQARRRA